MLQRKLSRIFFFSFFIPLGLITTLSLAASPQKEVQETKAAVLVKIPDPKFLAYLKAKIPNAFSGDEMNINSEDVTTLTRINVINKKVISFEGIGYFTALEEFNCTYNLAETLDLSKNTKLKYVVCWENRLTSLDLSKNTALLELNCGDNKITSLNVSKNTLLKELYCEYNQLASLDLSNNKELVTLNCVKNKLTTLDLSKNVKLEKFESAGNALTSVSKNKILVEIPDAAFRAWLQEKIPNAFAGNYLNVKHNNVVYLKTIAVSAKNITSLQGIEYFTGLEKLDCSKNKLTALDLSNNTALSDLNFADNPIASLDLRGLRYVKYLTDISANTSITQLKLHRTLRDDARIGALKESRGKSLTISVYSASAGSTDYFMINSSDIPKPLDNKYRNNS